MTDHYQALFDSKFLRWFDLAGNPALVTITDVERQELTLRGGAKKRAPVVTFQQVKGSIQDVKPLVMNRTNSEAIAAIHGVRVSEWIGKEVVLYESTTQLRGETVNCIRIRAKKV